MQRLVKKIASVIVRRTIR